MSAEASLGSCAIERLCTAATVIALLAIPSSALALTAIRVSGPVFHIGTTTATQGNYVAYEITNDDLVDHEDLWVSIEDFMGGVVAPAPGEDAIRHVGPLASGATVPVYFYLVASGPSIDNQTHEIRVFAAPPHLAVAPIASFPFSLAVEQTIVALSNQSSASLIFASPPVVGSTFIMTVSGQTGTIGSLGIVEWAPASAPDWPATAFELIGAHVDLFDPGTCAGPPVLSFDNALHQAGLSGSYCYEAQFTFRCTGLAMDATSVSALARVASGQVVKQSADLLEPAIEPPASALRLTKSISPDVLAAAGAVSCTLRWIHDGNRPARVDLLMDDLPAAPAPAAYVPGSARFDGVLIPDPVVDGDRLWFSGLFDTPAQGSSAVTFDMSVPGVPGEYVNIARSVSGNVQVDSTASPLDDAPVRASVLVGSASTPPGGPAVAFLHAAFPQPSREVVTIPFELVSGMPVTLTVVDVLGRVVAVLADGAHLPAGRHEARLSSRRFRAGVYMIRLEAGGRIFSRPLVVAR